MKNNDEDDIDFGDEDDIPEEEVTGPDDTEQDADEDEAAPPKKEPSTQKTNAAEKEELDNLKRKNTELTENYDRALKDKEAAETVAYEAQQNALKGAIERLNGDIKRENEQLGVLLARIEKARIDGDSESAMQLTKEIIDKNQNINQLNNAVNQYTPLLNQKMPTKAREDTKEEKVSQPPTLADLWIKDNNWWTDPYYHAKRQKAEEIVADLRGKNYEPTNLKFWTELDRRLTESEKKRTPPAFRNTRNPGVMRMTEKKKADADILDETNKYLELRGATIASLGEKEYKRVRSAAYKSIERQLQQVKHA